jgi:hypothetical protein
MSRSTSRSLHGSKLLHPLAHAIPPTLNKRQTEASGMLRSGRARMRQAVEMMSLRHGEDCLECQKKAPGMRNGRQALRLRASHPTHHQDSARFERIVRGAQGLQGRPLFPMGRRAVICLSAHNPPGLLLPLIPTSLPHLAALPQCLPHKRVCRVQAIGRRRQPKVWVVSFRVL